MHRVTVLTVAALLALAGGAAMDQHDHGVEFGTVRFPVSCNPEAQKSFEHGIALLHSFWYEQAEQAFADTTRTDPGCAMGYWGIAMTHYHPVWEPPAAADLKKGGEAVASAKAAGPKTQRERDYIAAMETFYRDSDRLPHRERALAWRDAMQRLSASYPEDREASIFYALSLIGTAPATDKTYASQKQAAAILNRILPEQPNHPGIAHYMIHSYDSPQLASLALPAAHSYAKIASGAPHALHMPSHIFVRLGLWDDSIASNIASARAAKEHIERTSPGTTAQDQLHAMDYLAYAYLQTSRDEDAKRVVDEAAAVSKVDQQVFQTAYALAAIPARYSLERRHWQEAAALTLRPENFPWSQFRFGEAITHFARALGAARTGNPSAAHRELEDLAAIQKSLVGRQGYDWATQVEVQRQGALAWTLLAEGDREGSLRWMRSAADQEDRSEKHPVTPGAVLPARELLGDLLLEMKRPAEAKAEFEAVLQGAPKRFHATYGAARAAELSGDAKQARQRYAELMELCGSRLQRPEAQTARAFLEKQ